MKKRIASAFLSGLLTTAVLTSPAQAQTYSFDGLAIASGLDYASAGFLSDGCCVVRKDTDGDGYDEYGLIDSTGKEIVPPKYDYMAKPVEGMARVGMDTDGSSKTGWKFNTKGIDKFGFVDMAGKEIVPLIYDRAEDFSDGLAAVSTTYLEELGVLKVSRSNTGFVDKTGKEVIPLIYDNVNGVQIASDMGGLGDSVSFRVGFSEGLAAVHKKDGKWGVIDKQGNTVIPFAYDNISGFSQGLASVYVNGKFGYMDKQGKLVIPAIYDEANDFKEGFAVVGKNAPDSTTNYRRGVIDLQGNVVVPTTYEALGTAFSEGMLKAAVPSLDSSGKWTGWKWGFLNTKGELVVPTVYYSINMFSEGLAVVNLPEGWTGAVSSAGADQYAVIDKQGNVVIPFQAESISSFSEGLAAVGSPLFPKYHYIDRTGATVIPKTSSQYGTSVFSGGVAVAYSSKSSRYSIIKNPVSQAQAPAVPDNPAPTPDEAVPAFTDVPAWCAKEAAWAAQKEITNGYGVKDKFAPSVDCTQAQILTMLWRAVDRPPAAAKGAPTAASSYQDAVNWAYEKHFISDDFDPDAPCTRLQAVTYIWMARNSPKASKAASFSDVDAGSPHIEAVNWAVEQEVTNGYGGTDTFAPDQTCNRGQIACFLYRAFAETK